MAIGLFLVGEALVVALLELLIERLDHGVGHTGHQLELPRVDHTHPGVAAGEGDDGAGELQLVHVEEALLLNAEVREELRVTPQVLRVLRRYLPREGRLARLIHLLLLGYAVSFEEAALVDEEVDEVEDGVAEEVPADGREDLALLAYDGLVGVGVAGGRVEARRARVLHLVELRRDH